RRDAARAGQRLRRVARGAARARAGAALNRDGRIDRGRKSMIEEASFAAPAGQPEPVASGQQGGGKPLSGYRVIEMCSTIAGPVCTRLMADFGAEVIKIEPPEGDAARNMGLQDQGESLYCASMLRNKQAVCIDLKTDEGRRLVRELIGKADFLVENFRPGTLERLGLGYDVLSRDNPGLILVRISGYGQDGPYS